MKRKIKPAILPFFLHLVAASFLASVIVVLFSQWWLFDLFTHFRIQYVLFGFLLLPVVLWLKKYVVASIVATAVLFHSVAVWPYLQSNQAIAGDVAAPHLTIMFANIYYRAPDLTKIEAVIDRHNPDTIILAELKKSDFETLQDQVSDSYPVSHFEEGYGAYDLSFFSKTEPTSFQVIQFTEDNPSYVIEYDRDGQPLEIVAIHPHSPIGFEPTKSRDEELIAAFAYAANLRQPTVVIGDFNSSQFSPKFQRLLKENRFVDTQLEFGIQPSWHAGYLPLFRIPIDQVVVNDQVKVYNRFLGEPTGSDHLPILVEVGVK